MAHRKWKELQNDEIYAIWTEYLRSEGLAGCDPLRLEPFKSRPMRLSPMEIIKLVDELIDRLEIKEIKEDGEREVDTGCNKAQGRIEGNSRCQERRKDSCCKA
jgi:hypothetical protein